MRDGIETSVFLTDGQAKQTWGGFYRSVAKLAGNEETDDTMYDCCKILVSVSVQDAIIQAYQDEIPGREDGKYYHTACDRRAEDECGAWTG